MRDFVYVVQCENEEDTREQLIDRAKQELSENYKSIQKKQEDNRFLEVVVNDYKQHFNQIRAERVRQYEAMNGLLEYIGRLTNEIETSKSILAETSEDQKALIKEMVKVKGEISDLS